MHKLNKVDTSFNAGSWGPPHRGDGGVELTHPEAHARAHVEFGTLPMPEAQRIHASIDPNKPYMTRFEFIAALASLTALFWAE
eukprot:4404897-Pyramimonas_sp.AAC.1